MTVRINANQFSLKYLADEDRLLFSVAMSSEHELGVLLTRRLTRNFVDALMKHAPEAQIAQKSDEAHAESGGRPGEAKEETRVKSLAFPPRLVREIKIVPKDGGDCAIVLNNGEQQLVLEVAAQRILRVTEIFLEISRKAGWDFSELAAEPRKQPGTELQGKVLH